MSFYKQLTLQDGETPYKGIRRPLMLGSSGGGGHISAIKGLCAYLKGHLEHLSFDLYTPRQAPTRSNPDAMVVRVGSKFTNQEGYLSFLTTGVVQPLLKPTRLPILPTLTDIYDEVQRLKSTETRPYLDMLLDVYPVGYEFAAIWNIQQQQGHIHDLKKMIAYQPDTDKLNWKHAIQHFTELLDIAVNEGRPYSEIVSTQVLSIPALCKVVYDYNKKYQHTLNIPKLFIHQYFTDLPTKGAVHFFSAVNNINPKHRNQIMLYGLGFKQEIIESQLNGGKDFRGIFDIPPHENPMVRPGFKDLSTSLHDCFDKTCHVKYKAYAFDEGEVRDLSRLDNLTIGSKDKVASITLSSQASTDTLKYIDHLLADDFDRIFVFGGYEKNIYPFIDGIVQQHADKVFKDNQDFLANITDSGDWPDDYMTSRRLSLTDIKKRIKEKIILLGKQDDTQMQPILTRSNVVIKRGGGLSVMEQIALKHHPKQCVFIHHPDCASILDDPSSGIIWEDENTNALIKTLRQKAIFAKKTMPSRFLTDYSEARFYHEFLYYLGKFDPERAATVGKVSVTNLELFNQFVRKLRAKERPLFAKAILNNNMLLHALNRMSFNTNLPLSRDIILLMMDSPRLIELVKNGEYTPSLVLHLLSHETQTPVKFKSINSFLSLLSVLYEPKYSYYQNHTHFTQKEIQAIKDNIFNTILTHVDLHSIIFIYLKRSREIRHVLGQVMKDLLIYQSNNLDQIYHSQRTLNRQSDQTQRTLTSSPLLSHEEKLLTGLDYLITRSYFKTGLFSSGFFEGWFGLGGSTIYYNNRLGKRTSNIVPKHMMLIHREIEKATDPNHSTTYTEALASVKRIIQIKTENHHARAEYNVFNTLLNAEETSTQLAP